MLEIKLQDMCSCAIEGMTEILLPLQAGLTGGLGGGGSGGEPGGAPDAVSAAACPLAE